MTLLLLLLLLLLDCQNDSFEKVAVILSMLLTQLNAQVCASAVPARLWEYSFNDKAKRLSLTSGIKNTF